MVMEMIKQRLTMISLRGFVVFMIFLLMVLAAPVWVGTVG
jgi:hypothetical protein